MSAPAVYHAAPACRRCGNPKPPALLCVACCNYLDEYREPNVEIRLDADGTLDEIVSRGAHVHLERMSHNSWWLRVGPFVVWLSAKSQSVRPNHMHEPMSDPAARLHEHGGTQKAVRVRRRRRVTP